MMSTSIALIGAVLSGSVLAAAKPDEAAWIVPSHIQMAPFMMPVAGRRTAPVTLYLKARSKKFVGNICNYVPRMRSAILEVMTREPVPVKRRKLILDGVSRRLLNPMNAVIRDNSFGKKQIAKIYIVVGARKMGGGTVSRLPFASINGCQSIRRAEAARIKKEAAKNEQ